MDLALTPVTDEELDHLELFHGAAAEAAVAREVRRHGKVADHEHHHSAAGTAVQAWYPGSEASPQTDEIKSLR